MARASIAIALTSLAVGACQPPPDRVGASSPDELRRPEAGPGHEILVPGCCSFSAAGLAFQRLPSDSYVLEGKDQGLEVSIAFGPFESVTTAPAATERNIDGISLRGWTEERPGGIQKIWVAAVPASAKGKTAGVRPYGLRITATCEKEADCQPADMLVGSLRF